MTWTPVSSGEGWKGQDEATVSGALLRSVPLPRDRRFGTTTVRAVWLCFRAVPPLSLWEAWCLASLVGSPWDCHLIDKDADVPRRHGGHSGLHTD